MFLAAMSSSRSDDVTQSVRSFVRMSVRPKGVSLSLKRICSDIEIDGVLQGSFKGVSRKFQGCFKKVSSVFQGSFKNVSREFQGCVKEVLRVFQGGFKSVSRKFKEGFKYVSRKF